MNKQNNQTFKTQTAEQWIKGKGEWGEDEECKGGQIYGNEKDQTLDSEHTMQCTDNILQNYTLETCIILLTNVTQ